MEKRTAEKEDLGRLEQYGLDGSQVKDAVVLQYHSGEFILREGEAMTYLSFVLSGKAKVCMDVASGKRYVLCYFVSSGIIGDMELMSGEQEAFTSLQAVTEFTCIGLPLAANARMLKNNPVFLNHVGRGLAYKLKVSDLNSVISALHTLEERLAAYIIHTAVNGVFCETLTDVAGLLGASYRHLLRCLDKFCRSGILLKQKNGFVIADNQKLEEKGGEIYKIDYIV